MKIKNKGKVYPSPSSSSSSSVGLERERDVRSVLKLLPATILTLASVLSLQDKEVLAYMITRSLNTSIHPYQNPSSSSSSLSQDSKKKSSKKPANSNSISLNPDPTNSNHKVPIFDCGCFDCYTSYWFRWDSSPNRELIHQAIEAFEDHLTNGEQSKKQRGNRRRDKSGRRVGERQVIDISGLPVMEAAAAAVVSPELGGGSVDVAAEVSVSDDGVFSPEKLADGEEILEMVSAEVVPAAETEDVATVVSSPAAVVSNHKGLARKVLPDVLGILNSRLWSLWGPNV